ncbi:Kdo domain containing protein [Seonamhaeicola sp. MEBiC1930]|uniref:Kdo domain containing protein n=1 Tax=Seonamhaeicola sp. MEBiC01930 TaxID=2976768 RepID=UPI0032461FC1
MNKVISAKYIGFDKKIEDSILCFDTKGKVFISGRNTIKLFEVEGFTINIKSFKIPNMVNQIAYRFLRKSKAQRSFEYANKLLNMDIGTPEPWAYFEFSSWFLFKRSYYVSEAINCEYTYRDLTRDFDIPDYENILRAFTRFTYSLHKKGVHFLDHSPGNTLIKKNDNGYDFYLVDLNRMKFENLAFEARIKNFSRLTIHKSMVEIMSDEYSKCTGEDYDKIFNLMWSETQDYQKKFYRKKRFKQKLKLKKK